jgi:hypothetical protein
MARRNDDTLLILGLGLGLVYLLGKQQPAQTATTTTPGQTVYLGGGGTGGCCGGGDEPTPAPVTPEPPKPSAAPVQQLFCTGGQIVRDGVCINPESPTPRLGSANNDAVLAELIRQQEYYNSIGNWDMAWQIAAKRDAWIKSQGY